MKKIFLAILISISIISCSSLKTVTNKNFVMNSPYFNQFLNITFEKNFFYGQSTLNNFSAEYSLSGKNITIQNFKQSQTTGSYSKTLQEKYIFDVIKNSKQLIINNHEIILISNDGKYLKYHEKTDLFF